MSEQGDQKSSKHADIGSERVARVYAEALLNAVEKTGEVDATFEQFDSLVHDVLDTNPLLAAVLSSPAVPSKAKAEIIEKICAGRASQLFTNFLLVLNDHVRLDLLRPILTVMHELANQRARRLRVLVRSAVPLPDDQRDRIAQGVHNAFQMEPILDLQVDPDLLGGLVLKIGDWLYDGSVRARLQEIRKRLIERSSHEIQSGRNRFSD